MELAEYKPKEFPKYTPSFINLINRWAHGTDAKVVGQMSDEVIKCPYKEYDKWKEWYLNKHPTAIEDATNLIIAKIKEVKPNIENIDKNTIKVWVDDLVIDKSFWGIKVQEAILKKIQKKTGIKCRLADKEEERKGFDGFIGNNPVQIKPDTYKVASNVKTEVLRAKMISYKKIKDSGNYDVDLSEVEKYLS